MFRRTTSTAGARKTDYIYEDSNNSDDNSDDNNDDSDDYDDNNDNDDNKVQEENKILEIQEEEEYRETSVWLFRRMRLMLSRVMMKPFQKGEGHAFEDLCKEISSTYITIMTITNSECWITFDTMTVSDI